MSANWGGRETKRGVRVDSPVEGCSEEVSAVVREVHIAHSQRVAAVRALHAARVVRVPNLHLRDTQRQSTTQIFGKKKKVIVFLWNHLKGGGT